MTASTEQELKNAHDDGYAEGWNEGFTAGKEQAEAESDMGDWCEVCDERH